MPPSAKYNVWTMLKELKPITTLIALIAIVLAANSIALEHSKGNYWNLRLQHRSSVGIIYWGNTCRSCSTLYLCFAATLLFAFVFRVCPARFGGKPILFVLSKRRSDKDVNAEVFSLRLWSRFIEYYCAGHAGLYDFGHPKRSAVVSVGLSLFVFFTGSAITQFLAAKFDWTKYTIFANSDLSQYIDGEPFIQDMTLSFSAAVIAVYFILFLASPFGFFKSGIMPVITSSKKRSSIYSSAFSCSVLLYVRSTTEQAYE